MDIFFEESTNKDGEDGFDNNLFSGLVFWENYVKTYF